MPLKLISISYSTDGADGEKENSTNESSTHVDSMGDKDSDMEEDNGIVSHMKKPTTGRSQSIPQQDESGERTILPPTNTRLRGRTKKLSEVSTGEPSVATSDVCANEDQENASTQNTPSSSASSSRYKINYWEEK